MAVAVVLLLAMAASAERARAQAGGSGERRVVQVVTLVNQPAQEAVALVLPLLSRDGTVELRPRDNAVVIRDSLAAIGRILPVLQSFDHPARELEIDVWVVQAQTPRISPVPPPEASGLPRAVLAELKEHLPYAVYRVVAEARVQGREGEEVRFELANGYRLGFRLGTVVADSRLRLHHFELGRRQSDEVKSLLRSHLNLFLGGTQVVALSSGKQSGQALMVVLQSRQVPVAASVGERR